ncbi:MAG: mechanosensitive ion channel [Alphaproteobacteria bacterium]|nr:mechanosensitive ion channel [Alphaproteobacteria bacterium]
MALSWLEVLTGWLMSPQFYAQVGAIVVAAAVARIVGRQILARTPLLSAAPPEGPFFKLRRFVHSCRDLLAPVLTVLMLTVAVAVCDTALGSAWLVRLAQGVAVVLVLYAAINRFVTHPVINAACRWIGIPVAALQVFGLLDDTTHWLDGIAFEAGNIRVSVYALSKAAIFGGLLFWLGRTSATAGQKVIRGQQALDIQTRELAAKVLEVAVFFVVGLLLLNILGLDLTALAVFGGALGVGLGFGLQQIASNFISGIIILLERSLKVGDYIELEDGRSGTLKEINMRSSSLATFDGKEFMVPNEKFITTTFTNWTKSDPLQRYEVEFQVGYDTDIHRIPPLVSAAVASHPAVLQDPEPPDCELRAFGNNGVVFAVEFWVNGIDDGPNKFSSDVRFIVWDALKGAGITMPYPRRDIRILPDDLAERGIHGTRPVRVPGSASAGKAS